MAESFASRNPSASSDTLRVPPHSVEAEQSVLGGLMLDNSAWDRVADRVSEDDFYLYDHRVVFRAIAELAEKNQPFDVVTLSDWLEQHKKELSDSSVLAYLGTLAKDTPSAANIRAYAKIVRERAVLRQLITIGTEIADSGFNAEGEDSKVLLDRAEQKVFQIADHDARGGAGFRGITSILGRTVEHIEKLYERGDPITGLATGFDKFDENTAGLQQGDLIIIAGRPSMGKSSLALNIAQYCAVKRKATVAIFSMEMPGEQIAMRFLSSLGRINQQRLRTGQLRDDDWPRFSSAVAMLNEVPLFIDDSAALTPTELRARARRLKREHDLGLIVVDYLQLMEVPGTAENRATEISEISRSLKALARELNLPIVALSQLNRSLEQRTDKRPVMSDLRECVTGDTLVVCADGTRVPISELVGEQPEVISVTANGKLTRCLSDKVWQVGRKPVFKVSLSSGRTIRCTGEHRLYGVQGWRTVNDLSPGDRLGIADILPEQDISHRSMAHMRGTAYGSSAQVSFAPSSAVISDYAELLDDDYLRALADSDVFWDRVVAIESDGEEEVYDLTVPGPESWLADGIISHNSGAIEQDADLIAFIYRDEVYDKDSPVKGTAEIIVGKQRNGPIFTTTLTFLSEYTSFENYIPEIYTSESFS